MDDRLLALRMAAWMEGHLSEPETGLGPELARISGYSENRLRQKFYNAAGETPAGYLRKRRLTEAARALLSGAPIADVALSYGYSSQDNFTTAFKSWFGLNPGELRAADAKYRVFLARMKEPLTIMQFSKLEQGGLATTLMGCLRGASDFFDLDWSTPKLFGYSSHAFLLNVHKELCPSSPYVWKHDAFYRALRGLGIRRSASICLEKGAGAEAIRGAEERVRSHLDQGKLCILDYLEHQLVAGYDSKGFQFLLPWKGSCGAELPVLSFGSWSEALEAEGWVQFTFLEKEEDRPEEASLLPAALAAALRARSAPEELELPGYRAGDAAWEAWIVGVSRGLGSSHGHWWNGTVWEECRSMAADFFVEVEPLARGPRAAGLCRELSALYRDCAARLGAAKDKAAAPALQAAALAEGRELDRRGEALMRELLAAVA